MLNLTIDYNHYSLSLCYNYLHHEAKHYITIGYEGKGALFTVMHVIVYTTSLYMHHDTTWI